MALLRHIDTLLLVAILVGSSCAQFDVGLCQCYDGEFCQANGTCWRTPTRFCDSIADCGAQQSCVYQANTVGQCQCPRGMMLGQDTADCVPKPVGPKRSCANHGDCDHNEQCEWTPDFRSKMCLCQAGYVRDQNTDICVEQWRAGFENQTCRPSTSNCRPNEVCHDNLCTCEWPSIYDWQLRMCRPQKCKDWCFQSHGDTCRLERCYSCWWHGEFECTEFAIAHLQNSMSGDNHSKRSSLLIGTSFLLIILTLGYHFK